MSPSMQSVNFEYHDVWILIKSIGSGFETGEEQHETFSSIFISFCTGHITYTTVSNSEYTSDAVGVRSKVLLPA